MGIKEDRKKKNVYIGPTPVAALGATDQHSQIQLYNEGPNDKTITFIEVDQFDQRLKIPASITQIETLSYAAGLSFQKLIHAEREATSRALTKSKRPNATIHLPRISADSMGQLMMFFELATAISGELYDINAFNQPGVEAGKKAMHDILK